MLNRQEIGRDILHSRLAVFLTGMAFGSQNAGCLGASGINPIGELEIPPTFQQTD